MAPRVLLFDIDGTLVLTGGAGARAMTRAFEDVYGVPGASMDGVPLSGRTDTWIVGEMVRRYGCAHDAASLDRFRAAYLHLLAREVEEPGPRKGVLPGVRSLLDDLAPRPGVHLALLTGNFEGGARVKLEHFDLWRYFPCGAFADDAPDRNGLFAEAMGRLRAAGGPNVPASDVVVVGDTPLDVAVAVANGARAVAVATGGYDEQVLKESGADEVLTDFSELSEALKALGVEV